MRALLLGLSCDELLPGVRPSDDYAPHASTLLPLISARLAASGDVASMVEAADAASAAGDASLAAGWLKAAVEAGPAADAMSMATKPHALLTKLAELQLEAGDVAEAAASFSAASEAAMEAGNMKASMKLADRAAALEPEEEEEEA